MTLERSTALAYHLGLPVQDFLLDSEGVPLRSEEFFIPGSLLEVSLNTERPIARGLRDRLIVNYARSPVFGVSAGAPGIEVLASFDDATPLRSGWAWGQEHLEGGAAMVEADVGRGSLFLFGPQITYRGQTHAAYPLLFNGILLSRAEETTLR
jgi:hypothetical protein